MKMRFSKPFTPSAEWLRSRFLAGLPDTGPLEDGVPPSPLRPAAVLVPIVLREPEPTVLLTRRTDHLHHHPGQVSFPGGRVEDEDTSPIETALRAALGEQKALSAVTVRATKDHAAFGNVPVAELASFAKAVGKAKLPPS